MWALEACLTERREQLKRITITHFGAALAEHVQHSSREMVRTQTTQSDILTEHFDIQNIVPQERFEVGDDLRQRRPGRPR